VDASQRSNAAFVYKLDDRPPLSHASVLAMQHVLTMFGATVSVPLLLGPTMGMSLAQTSLLISSVMLASGLATLLQVEYGTRLPIIQGVSFSFLAIFFAIIAAGKREGWTPAEMIGTPKFGCGHVCQNSAKVEKSGDTIIDMLTRENRTS
jgi:xanthine/uracil permease